MFRSFLTCTLPHSGGLELEAQCEEKVFTFDQSEISFTEFTKAIIEALFKDKAGIMVTPTGAVYLVFFLNFFISLPHCSVLIK